MVTAPGMNGGIRRQAVIIVATLATLRMQRAGLVNWRALAPLLAGSVPLAFIGGGIELPGRVYRILIGLVVVGGPAWLIISATQVQSRAAATVVGAILAAVAAALSGLLKPNGLLFMATMSRTAKSYAMAIIGALGALFSIGDGHCRQGEGETCGVAVEAAMDTVVAVEVVLVVHDAAEAVADHVGRDDL